MEYVKEYWGITEYYKNGVLHRDGDLPAVISARGDLEYWKNGRRHRDNGPAIIRKDGVCSFRLVAPVIRNTGRVEGSFIRELCSWGRSLALNLWDLL